MIELTATPAVVGACLLATAAIAACGGQSSDRPAPPHEPQRPASTETEPSGSPAADRTPRIVVTGRAVPDTVACRPRQTAAFVIRFLAAVNRGDPRAADLFDPQAGSNPGWYSVTSNAGAPAEASVSAMDRPALATYLAARHRERERLRLIELRVAGDNGLGHIEFALIRRAADLAGGAPLRVEGKGAVACEKPALVAWSSSVVTAEEAVGRLCPRSGRHAADAVVVCGRARGAG